MALCTDSELASGWVQQPDLGPENNIVFKVDTYCSVFNVDTYFSDNLIML